MLMMTKVIKAKKDNLVHVFKKGWMFLICHVREQIKLTISEKSIQLLNVSSCIC